MRFIQIFFLAFCTLLMNRPASAQPADPPKPAAPAAKPGGKAQEQLDAIVDAIQAKLRKGARTEADLADELKLFEAAIASHKGETTDAVGEMIFMYAMLYVEVLDDPEKALSSLRQLKIDFVDTDLGKEAAQMIPTVEKMVASSKIRRQLIVGSVFPVFEVKDLAGKPLSIAGIKGKVTMIDFWATWCGPCVEELPNVIKTYQAYHGKGFEIIGISLDEDRAKLDAFIKDKAVSWTQFFDGKGWENELAVKYGVNAIPATYLLDAGGKIIGKDLHGEELEKAVKAALEK